MKYLVPFALMATLTACKDSTQDTAACSTENESCGPDERGCGGEGQNMLPGSDCLSCHTEGLMPEEDEPDKWYSVGGTVFNAAGGAGVEDVTVRVTDSEGTVLELNTSSAGNFYSRESLVPPLTAEVERDGEITAMSTEVMSGACNTCHQCEGSAGGKIRP